MDLGYFTILSYNWSSSLSTVRTPANGTETYRSCLLSLLGGREGNVHLTWACPLTCHLNFKILAIKNHLHNSDLKLDFLKSPYLRGSIPFWDRILAPPFTANMPRKGIKHSRCIVKAREARGSNLVGDKVAGTDNRETVKSSEMHPRGDQAGNELQTDTLLPCGG